MKFTRLFAVLAVLLSTHASAAVLSDIVAVATGVSHTCALTSTGAVKCWGSNAGGQLGDGTLVDRLTPVDVVGLGPAMGIVAGLEYSCALTTAGGVKCWGNNALYRLGVDVNSVPGKQPTPVDVQGLASGVASITAASSSSNTCALMLTGNAKCWGWSPWGQLGDRTMRSGGSLPVDVTVVPNPIPDIGMGGSYSCALGAGGGVKCWGNGFVDQLGGPGSPISVGAAVDVSGLASGVAEIETGALKACAIMADTRAVKCWGGEIVGQGAVGGGPIYETQPTPADVAGLESGVAAVAAGEYQVCALTTAGGVKCWGFNDEGSVGDGTTIPRRTPVDVVGLSGGVLDLASGFKHACAVTSGGNVKCWGWNAEGQIGNRSTASALVPTFVEVFVAQAIDFAPLPNRNVADPPFAISATASSGLPVVFSSVTPWTCTVSGSTVTLVAPGACGIAANQAGNDTYDVAPEVLRTFTISGSGAPTPARLVNLSTRGFSGSANDVMIAGFVIQGSAPKTVAIRALGPSLRQYGISNWLYNPQIEVFNTTASIGSNQNWQDGATLPSPGAVDYFASPQGLVAAGLAPGDPLEAALIATLPPGAYTVVTKSEGNSFQGVALVEIYELDQPDTPAVNISTRGRVGSGNDVMIAGFVVGGSDPLTVVVTGKGPSLAQYGIAGPLSNPTLTLVRASDQAVIATNDDWSSASNAAQVQASGFAPGDRLESAILITLQPGAYTAIMSGAGGGTGVGLVEVYKATP